MRTIYKYPLTFQDQSTITLPRGAELLHIDIQNPASYPPEIMLWAMVETTNPSGERRIFMSGTGHQLPAMKIDHIGTVLHQGYVWHVFDGGDI